jgi:hypothetical protein
MHSWLPLLVSVTLRRSLKSSGWFQWRNLARCQTPTVKAPLFEAAARLEVVLSYGECANQKLASGGLACFGKRAV